MLEPIFPALLPLPEHLLAPGKMVEAPTHHAYIRSGILIHLQHQGTGLVPAGRQGRKRAPQRARTVRRS